MDRAYWEEVWRQDELGFHQTEVNRHLQRFWSRMQLTPDARVLVPLCGKSMDMHWLLSEGHGVIGVDFSTRAQESFIASRPEPVRYSESAGMRLAYQGRMLFVAGDVFHLTLDILRSVDAVYDRAALIALPPAMRQNYALFMAQWIKPAGRMLLITRQALEERNPPPFNVSDEEVMDLYAANFEVEKLCAETRADGVIESVFLLMRKQPSTSGILPADACESQKVKPSV